MKMTFPSNVHFRAKLVSSPKLHTVKKVRCSLSITSTLESLSPFFLFVWAAPASSPLFSSMTHIGFSAAIYYLLQSLLPRSSSPPHPHLSPITSLPCASSPTIRFFLISDFLCDWKISIILEGLHKSLPSHFLAEMAFLLICTVSDHIEHPLHTALIPISVKWELNVWLTSTEWLFHVAKHVFFLLSL